jgi:hypothetical protein
MKFAPFRAAGIFVVAILVPSIPFVAAYARHAPMAVGFMAGLLLIWGILFWAGARVAACAHSAKSLALAILSVWTFAYATTGLVRDIFPDVSYAELITKVLQSAFVFMAGWRLAPKVPIAPQVSDATV